VSPISSSVRSGRQCGLPADFNRGAAHRLGMQAVEFVGNSIDGDADGVVDEE
jgi:hypothetical protein